MITDGQFYMWRAVFAMAHVDGDVQPEEEALMRQVLQDFEFSEKQKSVLEADILVARNPMDMYRLIPNREDQHRFFEFAREMALADGVLNDIEKEALSRIEFRHNYKPGDRERKNAEKKEGSGPKVIQNVSSHNLAAHAGSLELEEEAALREERAKQKKAIVKKKGFARFLSIFLDAFRQDKF